jgi:hypothetical protein
VSVGASSGSPPPLSRSEHSVSRALVSGLFSIAFSGRGLATGEIPFMLGRLVLTVRFEKVCGVLVQVHGRIVDRAARS